MPYYADWDVPGCIKPTFDPNNPPDDIGSNPSRWNYWAPTRGGDPYSDFLAGEHAARECISDGIDGRNLLSAVFAAMIDGGYWGEFEAGFTSVIARKSLFGAKPHDFDEHTPAEILTEEQCQRFKAGMAHAIRDMRASVKSEIERKILPLSIMHKIETAVIARTRHPYPAGYLIALISSATACCAH